MTIAEYIRDLVQQNNNSSTHLPPAKESPSERFLRSLGKSSNNVEIEQSRRRNEKITIKRVEKRLYCMSCKAEKCDHVLYALNDKGVRKSLDIEYIHKITRILGSNFAVGNFKGWEL